MLQARADGSVALTPLARRMVEPPYGPDVPGARREALLRCDPVRQFLLRYDGRAMPRQSVAMDDLMHAGIAKQRVERVYQTILGNAVNLGWLSQSGGEVRLNLPAAEAPLPPTQSTVDELVAEASAPAKETSRLRICVCGRQGSPAVHAVEQVLEQADMDPVPAPLGSDGTGAYESINDIIGVMNDCDSTVIILEPGGHGEVSLDMETGMLLGSAMAEFGRRFILVLPLGADLPPALDALPSIAYEHEDFTGLARFQLLGAIQAIGRRLRRND